MRAPPNAQATQACKRQCTARRLLPSHTHLPDSVMAGKSPPAQQRFPERRANGSSGHAGSASGAAPQQSPSATRTSSPSPPRRQALSGSATADRVGRRRRCREGWRQRSGGGGSRGRPRSGAPLVPRAGELGCASGVGMAMPGDTGNVLRGSPDGVVGGRGREGVGGGGGGDRREGRHRHDRPRQPTRGRGQRRRADADAKRGWAQRVPASPSQLR